MRPFCLLAFIPLAAAWPALRVLSRDEPKPKYPWINTRISNLKVDCVKPDLVEKYNCTMQFDFYDPNSEPVQDINGASCEKSWDWDGTTTEKGPNNDFGDGFTICSIAEFNLFQVQVNEFRSASEWTITVSHKYKDDFHFNPPLNFPNSFTQIEIPKANPAVAKTTVLDRFHYEAIDTEEHPVSGLI